MIDVPNVYNGGCFHTAFVNTSIGTAQLMVCDRSRSTRVDVQPAGTRLSILSTETIPGTKQHSPRGKRYAPRHKRIRQVVNTKVFYPAGDCASLLLIYSSKMSRTIALVLLTYKTLPFFSRRILSIPWRCLSRSAPYSANSGKCLLIRASKRLHYYLLGFCLQVRCENP